jgi:hypothetical protein
MFAANLVEYFTRWPRSSMCYIIQTLPNSLFQIGMGGNIEQPLVCCGILDDRGCLSFHGKHDRALGLLELLYKVPGTPAKGC